MSDPLPSAEALECPSGAPEAAVFEAYPAREAPLGGGLVVRRSLPRAGRRLVGPWCFLDHFGPLAFDAGKPLDVAPHPHIGLQTVTWLVAGEVLHRDSLGSERLVKPGELNLMTAGRGIAHSEETPTRHSGRLHGLQLWVALPDAHRERAPRFSNFPNLPATGLGACRAVVAIGDFAGVRGLAQTYSKMIAVELLASRDDAVDVPLAPGFEHAVMPLEGGAALGDRPLEPSTLYYLGAGRERLALRVQKGARLFLLGGEPFAEPVVMWWNFVARTPEEIVEARDAWERGTRFGPVIGYPGARTPAPPFTARLRRPE